MAVNIIPASLPGMSPAGMGGMSDGGDSSDIRKKLAMALLQKSMSTDPIQSPWQGAAQMAHALWAGMERNKLRQEDAEATKSLLNLPGLGGGGGLSPAPPPPQAPTFNPLGAISNMFGGGGPSAGGVADAPPPANAPPPSPPQASMPPSQEPTQMAALSPSNTMSDAPPPQMTPRSIAPVQADGTDDIIRSARSAIDPIPLPRPRPGGMERPQPASMPMAAAPQVMASDGMAAPRPPASIPSPFGVNIPVRQSASLPKGLSERATSTLNPLIASMSQSGLPVQITSAFRDPSHNAKVGGAKGSQHMHGNAIDMSLKGMTEEQKQKAIAMVQSHQGVNGFGYYPKSDSIHLDVREGGRAAWGQNYSKNSVGQGWPEWMTKQTRNWQAGQPVNMAQQQRGVPLPRPRPPGAPQQEQQPQQPQPEMADARVRVASLGGMPTPDSAPMPQQAQAPVAPPVQMAQAGQGQAPQIPPQVAQNIKTLLSNPKTRAYGMQLYQAYNKPVTPTDDMKEYEASQKDPNFKQHLLEMKRAGAIQNAVQIDQRGESKFSEEAAKHQVKRFDDLIQSGWNAKAMRSDIETLRELGTRFETGKGAEIVAAFGPYAEALGVKVDNLGGMQAYNAIVSKLAPRMRPAGAGATSDFEMQKYLEALPGLGKTPEGNALISSTMEALQNHQEKAAEIASMALNKELTPKEADKMLRDMPDPMTAWKEYRKQQKATESGSNAPVRKYNPATGRIE